MVFDRSSTSSNTVGAARAEKLIYPISLADRTLLSTWLQQSAVFFPHRRQIGTYAHQQIGTSAHPIRQASLRVGFKPACRKKYDWSSPTHRHSQDPALASKQPFQAIKTHAFQRLKSMANRRIQSWHTLCSIVLRAQSKQAQPLENHSKHFLILGELP